jgi:hypothetical protein
MADFVKELGRGFALMIRQVNTSTFQFFFRGRSDTWNYQQQWSWAYRQKPTSNMSTMQRQFRMERSDSWQYMGENGDVGDLTGYLDLRVTIYDAGLGFATTSFDIHLDNAIQPDKPPRPIAVDFTNTSLIFDWAGDGNTYGMPVLEREVWHSFNRVPMYFGGNPPPGRFSITGLQPGTTYSVFSRVRTAFGWSPFSDLIANVTARTPYAPDPVQFNDVQQRSVWAWFRHTRWDGRNSVKEGEIGYGLSPNGPTAYIRGFDVSVANLQIAKRYYFWARVRNDYGWSDWSGRSEVLLNAGAWVKVNGTWRRALPWVKVGGVWRVAKPNLKERRRWRVPRS